MLAASNADWFLKPNLVIEPLFDRWYAWAHLISPATSAMNVRNRHLKILDSYIQNPQIHADAAKNPRMRGGPFVNFNGNRVREAIELRDRTKEKKKYQLEFADAIIELESSQTLAFWLTNNDERPFVLSTPRLNDPNVIHCDIPFRHGIIDRLKRMQRTPAGIDDIIEMAEILKIKENERSLFLSFFTNQAPEPYKRYTGDKVRMRYFGHACILVETKELSVLVDPVISYHGYPTDLSRYSDMHLPDKIDHVMITHNHQDHILFETLLALRHRIGEIIVPKGGNGSLQDPNLKEMFSQLGFENVVELGEFDKVEHLNCTITGIPFIGEHADLDIRSKICYHVRLGRFPLLFVADSCNVEPELYRHVFDTVGPVDSLFLGMECDGAPLSWLYGPLLTEDLPRDMDNSRRLAGSNYERGKALVDVFRPKELYVYAMGMEPWLEFISSIKYTDGSNPIIQSKKLIQECRSRNIVAELLFGEKELFYDIGELSVLI